MRGIISKFVITLILLFTVLSIFWFFKTSGIKKHVLALILSSGGQVSAASISVSGFPMEQNLKIDDLKIQISLPSKIPSGIFPSDKYQIIIKKLEASAGIFSGNFKINAIEDVSLQSQDGAISTLQFNQPPISNFSFVSGELTKFSYKDSGYKVIDVAKNVMFENGVSSINFESAIENNQYHNKIKADFKDLGAFNFDNTPSLLSPDTKNPVVPDFVAQADVSVVQETPTSNLEASSAPNTQSEGLGMKKNFVVDLEYFVSKPSQSASPVPVPNPSTQNTATSDIALLDEKSINSVSIKNFEISSPLYKININGEITSLPKDTAPIYRISARVEKLDNVLIYIKKFTINTNPAPVNVKNVSNASVPSSDSATSPAANQKPEVDIVSIIKDLSKKNAATNEEIAVFDFRQEQGKDLLINEISFAEVSGQVFTGAPDFNKTDAVNTDPNTNNSNANQVISDPTSSIASPQVAPVKKAN